MKTATPEAVENYLRSHVGDESLRNSINVSLTQAKSRASSLLVEKSIQELEPANFESMTSDEQSEWTEECATRTKQYEEALQECVNVIAMLEEQLEKLPPEPETGQEPAAPGPKITRAERRRRDATVAKAVGA